MVADTSDLGVVTRLKPVDGTTNPTIAPKAVDTPEYRDVVDDALAWRRGQSSDATRVAAAISNRLAAPVGAESRLDGDLVFQRRSIGREGHRIIDDAYKQ